MIPKIKICGITKVEEIAYLVEANVDYAGFVFFEKSKRHVGHEQAKALMKHLPENIKPVAVCVSPDENQVKELLKLPIKVLQIHGSMDKTTQNQILQLCKNHSPDPVLVWQAVNITNVSQLEKAKVMEADGYVIDGADYGAGVTFNWQRPKDNPTFEKMRKKKLILAGGLNKENVAKGIEVFTPDVVDVSSGVEGSFGKDKNKLFEFVKAVRCDG